MATYTAYNFRMPTGSWKDYMPEYKTYDYTKPKDIYSDYDTPYGYDIRKAQVSLENLEKNKPGQYNSAYDQRINQLINSMGSRKFSYDMSKDPLYQQYRENYMTQGKQAMQDTIGQASALTGGYGNSYAAAAGNQAYQAWLGQLNNKLPELYQLALQRYNAKGDEMSRMYSMLANQDATDYGRYRDTVSDYENDRAYYDARLQNLRTMGQNLWGQNWSNYLNTAQMNDANRQNAINAALNLYGQDWDNYKWGESQTAANRAQAVAEDQWNANFAENQRQFNASQAQANAQAAQKYAYETAQNQQQAAMESSKNTANFNDRLKYKNKPQEWSNSQWNSYIMGMLERYRGKYNLSDNDVASIIRDKLR